MSRSSGIASHELSGWTVKEVLRRMSGVERCSCPKCNGSHIFLDDKRQPHDVRFWIDLPSVDWLVVKDFKQFKAAISNRWPEFVAFDHDLHESHHTIGEKSNYQHFDYAGLEHATGFCCAFELARMALESNRALPKFIVHSMNDRGRYNIYQLLESFTSVKDVEHLRRLATQVALKEASYSEILASTKDWKKPEVEPCCHEALLHHLFEINKNCDSQA